MRPSLHRAPACTGVRAAVRGWSESIQTQNLPVCLRFWNADRETIIWGEITEFGHCEFIWALRVYLGTANISIYWPADILLYWDWQFSVPSFPLSLPPPLPPTPVLSIPLPYPHPQVLRYENGQAYGAHWDWFSPEELKGSPAHAATKDVGNRVATVLMYLSGGLVVGGWVTVGRWLGGGRSGFRLGGRVGCSFAAPARLANAGAKGQTGTLERMLDHPSPCVCMRVQAWSVAPGGGDRAAVGGAAPPP